MVDREAVACFGFVAVSATDAFPACESFGFAGNFFPIGGVGGCGFAGHVMFLDR